MSPGHCLSHSPKVGAPDACTARMPESNNALIAASECAAERELCELRRPMPSRYEGYGLLRDLLATDDAHSRLGDFGYSQLSARRSARIVCGSARRKVTK